MAYVPLSYHVNAPRGGTRYIMKQVRFHRNIAASSLAADCNVPQRPPAEKKNIYTVYTDGLHTHTHQVMISEIPRVDFHK